MNVSDVTVLVVDDDKQVLALIARALRAAPYRLLTASSPQEALELAGAHPPNVVIADYEMPVMSGPQFFMRVRQFWGDTVQIALTGYGSAEVVDEYAKAGVDGWIAKPFTKDKLNEVIDRAVALAITRRATRAQLTQLRTTTLTFAHFFRECDLPMAIVDERGYIAEVNRAWVRQHGDSPQDAVRARPHVVPAEVPHSWAEIRSAGTWAADIEVDGSVRHLVISAIRDYAGEVHAYGAVERDVTDRRRLEQQMEAGQFEVLQLAARLAEYRDPETGAHLERMRLYSRTLAELLVPDSRWDVDEGYVVAIDHAAPLHDIGKIGVPDAVLLKPGKFTPEEWAVMQTHTTIGSDILLTAGATLLRRDYLAMGQRIAHEHHEKWNGSGYPRGIRGKRIATAARIVAIADAYDAITSKRVYKEALSHDRALAILVGDAGTHFDAQLVEVVVQHAALFDRIRRRYQD
jgi:response regulator RpfG family c-di-GMP phosphodiesterase